MTNSINNFLPNKMEDTNQCVNPKANDQFSTQSCSDTDIQHCIFQIRGLQVMLDRDLAGLYGVETKRLNEQVKRNIERFPENYMFPLSKEENSELVAKCDRFANLKHSTVPMTAFTEHGIIMLASILRSKMAIETSVRITNTFVAMRRTMASLGPLLSRIEANEQRQLECQMKQLTDQAHNEERFHKIFQAIEARDLPSQKIFFNGEVFDADIFVTQHIQEAQQSIVLIDNWVDIVTLEMLAKKRAGVLLTIITSQRGNKLAQSDIDRFNLQYGNLCIKTSTVFHDRFLILDNSKLFLIGASLKDIGEKCFAFSQLDGSNIPDIMGRL